MAFEDVNFGGPMQAQQSLPPQVLQPIVIQAPQQEQSESGRSRSRGRESESDSRQPAIIQVITPPVAQQQVAPPASLPPIVIKSVSPVFRPYPQPIIQSVVASAANPHGGLSQQATIQEVLRHQAIGTTPLTPTIVSDAGGSTHLLTSTSGPHSQSPGHHSPNGSNGAVSNTIVIQPPQTNRDKRRQKRRERMRKKLQEILSDH